MQNRHGSRWDYVTIHCILRTCENRKHEPSRGMTAKLVEWSRATDDTRPVRREQRHLFFVLSFVQNTRSNKEWGRLYAIIQFVLRPLLNIIHVLGTLQYEIYIHAKRY